MNDICLWGILASITGIAIMFSVIKFYSVKNINIKVLRICIFSTFANGKKEAVYLRNMYNI